MESDKKKKPLFFLAKILSLKSVIFEIFLFVYENFKPIKNILIYQLLLFHYFNDYLKKWLFSMTVLFIDSMDDHYKYNFKTFAGYLMPNPLYTYILDI